MKTETEKAIDINIVMGDLEYLIRDGLDDPRALTKKGLKITKKILRDAYTLLQQGEKYQDIFETIVEWSTGDTITYNDLVDLEQKYFPKELPDEKTTKL